MLKKWNIQAILAIGIFSIGTFSSFEQNDEFESRYKTNPLAETFDISQVDFDWWHYGTYNIKYKHEGGDPNGYPNIRLEDKTLRIVVDQATAGYFLIGIPRSFLNSYNFCDEYPFDISNSIQKEDWEEISSGDIRFLKINLSASKTTYLIEIRGTDLMKDAQDKIKKCGNPVKSINNPAWMMVGDDTMKKEIFINQSFEYVDDLGDLHIVGEIVNNKDQPINFVKVIASIYDVDKNFIDSSFSYTTSEIISPYTKSPFDVIFSGGSQGIDSYNLQMEYLLSQQLPMKLYAKQPRITDDELGYVHVKGEIQNTGEQTAHFVKVVGSVYDSNQKLIGISFTYTTKNDIYPNQSSPYDLVFTDLFGDPVSYQIFAESVEYGMHYEYPTSTIDVTPVDTVGEITQENKPTLLKCGEGTIEKNGECVSLTQEKGGCLIATATYGSELSPQVQQLRELRDNYLMKTESGTSFMTGFNQFYYSFSPTIADWERQNPIFKEAVKIGITPLLTSLSILNYVDMDSEEEVLGYGISLIILNIGMYIVAPVGVGMFVVSRKSKNS